MFADSENRWSAASFREADRVAAPRASGISTQVGTADFGACDDVPRSGTFKEMSSPSMWQNTTHDWAATVDSAHLAQIRTQPELYAPGGVLHLILEVISYPLDEALHTGTGRCVVTLHADGSVSVDDNGRGTDTRQDEHGRLIKKPIMATKDLRFFDAPDAPVLADGQPRRGMSVVAALSSWLIHTNRRHNGSWTQRYEHGVPVTDLVPIAGDATTGTTVQFMPDPALVPSSRASAEVLTLLAPCLPLTLEVNDQSRPDDKRPGRS
jgi:DNA gyrase subunit B